MDEAAERAKNERLLALRGYRVFDRARSLGDDCERLMGRVERVSADHDALGSALDTLAPETIKGRVWVERCVRGAVTLAARDAAARYTLDRWLRSGGEDALRRESKAGVRSVKTRIVS